MFAASKTSKAASGVVPDQYFDYVTALLNTSGTNGAQNNTFIDSSTNNFTITRNGNTTQGSFSPFGENWSNYFDGTGDWLTITNSTALNPGTGNFTIEAWVYLSNTNERQIFSGSNNGVVFGVNNLGQFTVGQANVAYLVSDTTSPITLNQWIHLAAVRQGTTLTLYRDGVNVGSATNSTNFVTSATNYIGGNGTNSINAYISNFRLAIGTALYTANFTPSTVPLQPVSGTRLLTCQSPAIIDDSPNQFTITRNGDVSVQKFGPFAGTTLPTPYYAAYFDGSGDSLNTPASANFAFGTGDFTAEFWVNFTSISGRQDLVWWGVSASDRGGVIYNELAGNLTYYISPTVGRAINYAWTPSINTWYHIALVRSSGSSKLYLNGAQVSSTYADSKDYASSSSLITVAKDSSAASSFLFGSVSNLRIIKGTALYTANFTPSTTPLQPVSGTSLLTCQSPAIVDDSPNQFTITRAGDVSVQKFGPFAGTTLTTPYYAAYFDGTGDYLTVPSNAALNITSGSTDSFICEAWVYFSTVGPNMSIIDNGGLNTVSFSNWLIYLNASSQISIGWGNSAAPGSSIGILPSSTVPVVGQWYHLALVKTSSDWSLFINGTRATTFNGLNTASKSNSTALYIGFGINTGAGGTGFAGSISNVRIYNGATASAPYSATSTTITVPTAPLTAISGTSLLTCQSSTFIDNSTNNFAITVSGNARPTTATPFTVTYASQQPYTPAVFGGSGYFDGTGDWLTVASPTSALNTGATYTIEAYVYPTILNTTNMVFTYTNNNVASFGGWILRVSSAGTITFECRPSTGGTNVQVSGGTVLRNSWSHIAVSVSSNAVKLFLNGVQVQTGTVVALDGTQNNMAIGALTNGAAAAPFTGYISDARLVVGTALYASAFVPPTAPLTPITNTRLLINSTNAGIYDAATISDFETVGNAQVSTGAAKYGTSSIRLDGTGDYLAATNPVIALGNGDFTVEGWVYYVAVTNSGIFQIGATIFPAVTGLGLGVDAGGAWLLYYGTSSQTGASTGPSGSAWIYFTVVRNNGTIKVYANGVATSISVADTTNYTGTVLGVGGIYSTAYLMNGYLQDLRITRGIARYTTNFTPPTAALPTF